MPARLTRLSPLPKLKQMLCLDLEQTALNRGGPTQPPQEACQSEHEFSFDGRLRVVVGRDSEFKGCIVLGIFQCIDHGFCSQAMSDGIEARAPLSLFGHRSGAEPRVAAIG